MELTQHPLSAAFPAMSAEEFQELKDDIEVNGQREPVVVLDDMVLDGWHRYRACNELILPVKQVSLPPDEDPVAFVLSHNLKRRHLTASQRAAAVVECSKWAPSGRPKNLAPGARFSTNKKMATTARTSERTISDAKVADKAGLGDDVKSGKLTAKEAAARATGKSAKSRKGTPKSMKTTPHKCAPWDAPPPEAGEPEPAELAATQREVAAELEAQRKILQADAPLAAAVAEAEQLRAHSTVQQARIDDLLAEKAKLVERVQVQQARIDDLHAENAKLVEQVKLLQAKLDTHDSEDQPA
jgi:hypothetical protein